MKNKVRCPLWNDVLRWYDDKRTIHAPSFGRLWGLARRIRRVFELKGRVTDEELLELTMEAIDYCLQTFNPERGNRLDLPVEKRFSTYFCLKLKHLLCNWIAMRMRWLQSDKVTTTRLASYQFNPLKMLMEEERDAWINEAVDKLKWPGANIIRQRYWEGKKFLEIGKNLGMKEGTVRQNHWKALRKIKNNIKKMTDKWHNRTR